jgi:hypothetical protein
MRLARVVKTILESEQLRVLVKTYNIHFEEYSNNIKKKVMHVVPNVVWKKVYVIYLLAYMNNLLFGRDFEGTLREVKIGRSNSDIGLSVCLQSSVVFERLR